jgi:uroporphyrinogen decarboxylase
MTSVNNNRFFRACHGLSVDRTPIWLMRQAGRYMPEYRALRQQHGILDIIRTPELACEVTLQPINAFDLDAAIIFADILPPLTGLGFDLEFVKGEGPLIHNPIRTLADVQALHYTDPREYLTSTLTAIQLVNHELSPRGIPLIGFAGAPFTLASYAIEGSGGTQRLKLKQLMYQHPDIWHQLMSLLARTSGEFLLAQAQAGAHVLQLFDSWVGELSPYDYRTYVAPYTRQTIAIAQQAQVPIIHFGTNTTGLLPDMRAAGGDIMGVDWRCDIDHARSILGPHTILQGNLDPMILFADTTVIATAARHIIDRIGHQGQHIFNLGHGILQHTPVDHVKFLVDYVHTYSEQYYAQ